MKWIFIPWVISHFLLSLTRKGHILSTKDLHVEQFERCLLSCAWNSHYQQTKVWWYSSIAAPALVRDQTVLGTQSILTLGLPLLSTLDTLFLDMSCLSDETHEELTELSEVVDFGRFGTHWYLGLTIFLFDLMGATTLVLEFGPPFALGLFRKCELWDELWDDLDLTEFGLVWPSLELHVMSLLSLAFCLLALSTFQSPLDLELEGCPLKTLPLGTDIQSWSWCWFLALLTFQSLSRERDLEGFPL
jgi:hypothetical protein